MKKQHIRLTDISTLPTEKIGKEKADAKIAALIQKLAVIQNKLYAQQKYSVLIVLQGMDTSGKDGAVRNVFSGVNPAGCNVKSFKMPTTEEFAHHFLWRISTECPQKGMIQIFNRSHYEDILAPIVNKSAGDKHLKSIANQINAFEKGLIEDNTIILKFYLHISHKEQIERLAARKTQENKRWKYQKGDALAISKHKEYRKAYETIFKHCSDVAPWQIIPADLKWYKNYRILKDIVHQLEQYPIDYPEITEKQLEQQQPLNV